MLLQIRTLDLAEPSPTYKTIQAKLCHSKDLFLVMQITHGVLSNRLGGLEGSWLVLWVWRVFWEGVRWFGYAYLHNFYIK